MTNYGPPYVETQTEDGVTWFCIRDYGHRQEGLKDGTGCFYTFQSQNADGTWGDWVLLNGGLIDRTPGKEQGDLDLIVAIDGKPGGFAIVGNMAPDGPGPGLVPVQDRQMSVGANTARILDLFLGGVLDVITVGKQIFLDGRWQWVDCIPIRTQQGLRWLPVYTDATQQ